MKGDGLADKSIDAVLDRSATGADGPSHPAEAHAFLEEGGELGVIDRLFDIIIEGKGPGGEGFSARMAFESRDHAEIFRGMESESFEPRPVCWIYVVLAY